MKKTIFTIFISLLVLNPCLASEQQVLNETGLIFVVHQETLGEFSNWVWDGLREWISWTLLKDAYGHIYYVRGKQLEDPSYMQEIWQRALEENEQIDYISFVHGGRQHIQAQWISSFPKNKLRMVYSEACRGGSGKEFLQNFDALVAAGHNPEEGSVSASPFYSLPFLYHWSKGSCFKEALKKAWETGCLRLQSSPGFYIAQKVGGYRSIEEAISQSLIYYSYWSNSSLNDISIYTSLKAIPSPRGEIVEQTVLE